MPQLSAFPKLWMTELCKTGTRSLDEWFQVAAELELDGIEWYAGFLETQDPATWAPTRRRADELGLAIPMMCCSPDFTHPDPEFRQEQVEQEKRWIDMAYALRCRFCRVLSGQRRPEVSRDDGIRFAAESIKACLPMRRSVESRSCSKITTRTITGNIRSSHRKWMSFAISSTRIDSPHFGVNYDPSNAHPRRRRSTGIARQHQASRRHHARQRSLSDRRTIDDLRREEAAASDTPSDCGTA